MNKRKELEERIDEEKADVGTTDVKASEADTPPAQEPKPERLIYIGPNLAGGLLMQYSVFKGGIPAYLEEVRARLPQLSDLFVPVEQLHQASQRTMITGTPENIAYQALAGSGGEVSNGV